MEDKKLDLEAPLISVRRFSGGSDGAAPSADSESPDADRDKAPRRSSLPFYKTELRSGPVRNPGAIPFGWEQKPGQPKNDSAVGNSGGEVPVAAPKPPPGRIVRDRGSSGEQSTSALPPPRIGSSVRTRKAVTFALDAGAAKPPPPAEDGPKKVDLDKEKMQQRQLQQQQQQQQQPIRKCEEEDEEEDAFSDAHDTLSRAESFFMNCSVSGISGIPESAEPPTGFSTDPQVREFMMGRFLPAAKAMASDSPQYTFRKAPAPAHERAANGGEHRRPPVSFQHKPYDVSRYVQQQQQLAHDVNSVGNDDDDEDEDHDEEEDYDDPGRLASKGCGFLPNFCLKSSFFLLNPVPGIKVRGSIPPPPRRRIRSLPAKSSHNGSTGHPDDEHSWEAVYRHKLGQGNYRHEQEDDRSKVTRESNQLTYWSDSPTADGSSPFRPSTGGGISPYREASQSPFHEGKGFLGVPSRESKSSKTDGSDACEKDGESYWEVTPHTSSQLDSGSISLGSEKNLYVDSVDVLDAHDPDSSSSSTVSEPRRVISSYDKDSKVGTGTRRIEERSMAEACQADALQPKVSNFVAPVHLETANRRDKDGDRNPRRNEIDKVQLHFDSGDLRKRPVDPLQPILPPPLPKSPSESWLSRTLPSVSSNNPVPQSLLGIKCQRKQAFKTPAHMKQLQDVKPSKPQHRQIRFAEVLIKPKSPKSEI